MSECEIKPAPLDPCHKTCHLPFEGSNEFSENFIFPSLFLRFGHPETKDQEIISTGIKFRKALNVLCNRVKIDPLDPSVTVGNNTQIHLHVHWVCEKSKAKLQIGTLNPLCKLILLIRM